MRKKKLTCQNIYFVIVVYRRKPVDLKKKQKKKNHGPLQQVLCSEFGQSRVS